MKYTRLQLILIFTLMIVSAGCSTSEQSGESNTALMMKTDPPPIATNMKDEKELQRVKEIKETVLANEKLYDVAVIKGKKDVLVAYKVKHLHRFRMKQIEKELKKELEEKFPKERITVSSDYKIFLETVRLQEKTKKDKLSNKEMENQLSKIIKLSREKT